MFHLELRQFPHNACRFNLGEAELLALVESWAREQWVELGERKWSPHQARLTVLEGPRLAVQELSMGRGWRNAVRQGEDVTERVLTQAKASIAGATSGGPGSREAARAAPLESPTGPSDDPAVADSPGAELLSLLGDDPGALLQAWRLAAQRRPELAPSECLALAEKTLRSLGRSPR
ncbi:MAG TPA: hypothetical protein VES65_07250 [Solirubrobacteraceae bacterium]|nr:hypothetical protein [Solirubrobacteraceae bacterium]